MSVESVVESVVESLVESVVESVVESLVEFFPFSSLSLILILSPEFNSLFFKFSSRVVIILGWLDLDFGFESSYCLIIYIWAHGLGFDSRLR